jgi:hypothetical protein
VYRFDAADPSISSHSQPVTTPLLMLPHFRRSHAYKAAHHLLSHFTRGQVLRHLVEKIAASPLSPSAPNFADLEAKRKKISALATSMI